MLVIAFLIFSKSVMKDVAEYGILLPVNMASLVSKSFLYIHITFNLNGSSLHFDWTILSNWIKEDYQKPFKDKLLDPTFCDTMGLNRSAIERMLSKHILDRKDYKWPLFSLYSLSVWNKYEREYV